MYQEYSFILHRRLRRCLYCWDG